MTTNFSSEVATFLRNNAGVNTLVYGAMPYYMQEHRLFHNLDHVEQVINDVMLLAIYYEKPPEIVSVLLIAAAWHDAVYTPNSDVNEQASADLLRFQAPLLLNEPSHAYSLQHAVCKARVLIPKTDVFYHQNGHGGNHTMAAILCDADLAGLACNYNDFVQRQRNILLEQGKPTDRSYLISCGLFLERLKKKKTGTVFNTEYAANLWGAQAQKNIEMLKRGVMVAP